MKYYSEKTNKTYDTELECLEAEKLYDKEHAEEIKKAKERKNRAEEINNVSKELEELRKKYYKLIENFVKDYGSYHTSIVSSDLKDLETLPTFINSIFKTLFK